MAYPLFASPELKKARAEKQGTPGPHSKGLLWWRKAICPECLHPANRVRVDTGQDIYETFYYCQFQCGWEHYVA